MVIPRRDGQGFPRAGRAAPRDFPRGNPKGNPKEQPCQPEGNPVLLNSHSNLHSISNSFFNSPKKKQDVEQKPFLQALLRLFLGQYIKCWDNFLGRNIFPVCGFVEGPL